MRELTEVLARALVDDPDQVVVTERKADRDTIIEVRVAPGDLGKVIGKQGRIAKAIRQVVRAAAGRDGRHVVVEFVE